MKKSNNPAESSKPWTRLRHKVAFAIFGPLVYLGTRLKYNVTADRFLEQNGRQYLILYNHQTPLDQFFFLRSFKGPVYHVATEDIFSIGFVSKIIQFLVAPIPIKKQTMDSASLRMIFKVAKEGGTIAIAPEGNRTYSGKTENIKPGIANLAKTLRLPIVLYRIEGGYGVEPRWSDRVRKGKMRAYVSRVIEPEEAAGLSREELYEIIKKELYVNEAESGGIFRSDNKAEYLERMVYVCPECGLAEFMSSGDEIECLKCHAKARYNEDKSITGSPFHSANEWYEYQKDFINMLDVTEYVEIPMFTAKADIYEVIVYKNKKKIKEGAEISLFGDRLEISCDGEKHTIPFEDMTATAVLGRNKMNLYYKERVFQFRGGKRFNALKYVNIYYRYRNQMQGDNDGEFLGL